MRSLTPSERDDLTEFMEDAACQGDTSFIPPSIPHGKRLSFADWNPGRCKAICETCKVASSCHEWALVVRPPAGVWAGVNWGNSKERRIVLKGVRK